LIHHALLDLIGLPVSNNGDDNDKSDDEEPYEFGSNRLFRVFTELAFETTTAHALSIAALAIVFADTAATFSSSFERSH